MKKIIFWLSLACWGVPVFSQARFSPLDKSPMGMSYYPYNYPILKIQDKATEPLITRIIYCRPQKDGRVIFGDLLEYGKVWRLGANEATEIEFYKDVRIEGKSIKKGRYTLYAIPFTDKWTLILNKETDIWGAFKYDSVKDILRIDAPVQKQSEPLEVFSISFEKIKDKEASMVFAWDDVLVRLPFSW
jgi:hypothetical protein